MALLAPYNAETGPVCVVLRWVRGYYGLSVLCQKVSGPKVLRNQSRPGAK